jgi:hypothetical protein
MTRKKKQPEVAELPGLSPAGGVADLPDDGKKRDRMAFDPGDDLSERIRNYAYWTPGATLNEFLFAAAQKEIAHLERTLNGGKPWPPRRSELKPGRKMSR